jgi:hypothetical protein
MMKFRCTLFIRSCKMYYKISKAVCVSTVIEQWNPQVGKSKILRTKWNEVYLNDIQLKYTCISPLGYQLQPGGSNNEVLLHTLHLETSGALSSAGMCSKGEGSGWIREGSLLPSTPPLQISTIFLDFFLTYILTSNSCSAQSGSQENSSQSPITTEMVPNCTWLG